jgi:hypothetical protein
METNDAANDANTPKKKRGRPKGLPKTGGNIKGQPRIPKNLREVLREVLGLENLVIRKRLQRWFETGDAGGLDHGAGLGSATFRHIMLMGYGQPKHAMESGDKQQKPVLFVSRHGYKPYDARANPEIDERSRRLNAELEADLKLESGKMTPGEVIIDAKATTGDTDAAGLVSVDIPPLPETFDPYVRERDRPPRGQR